MEITSVTLGMIFSGVAIATLLIIIYGSRGSKDKEHWMGNIEILGRPQYRSRKLQEEQEQNQATRKESKKRPADTDLEYERDAKDWWWCDDVWLSHYKSTSNRLKRLLPNYSMTSQSSQVGTWFNASTTKKSYVNSLKKQWILRSEIVAIGNDQIYF